MSRKVKVSFSMSPEDLAMLSQLIVTGFVSIQSEIGEDHAFAVRASSIGSEIGLALAQSISSRASRDKFEIARKDTQDELDAARAGVQRS